MKELHNVTAERAIIGAFLIEGEKYFDDVLAILPDEKYFYDENSKNAYRAIMALREMGSDLDILTIADFMKSWGKLDKDGGAKYLNECMDKTPHTANTISYAKKVRDWAIRRRLKEAGYNIIAAAEEDGTESVIERVDKATKALYAVDGVQVAQEPEHVADIMAADIEYIEKLRSGEAKRVTVDIGIEPLDELIPGLEPGDDVIIAARPSIGKTALACGIAAFNAYNRMRPTLFFSIEMTRAAVSRRILSRAARINLLTLRSGVGLMNSQMKRIRHVQNRFKQAPLHIDDRAKSPAEMLAIARKYKKRYGLSLIIIDYIQLMTSPANAKASDTEKVTAISLAIKSMAKELQVPVIALSQLNRLSEGRADKRPQLSDLRQSGAIEQDADIVMFIHKYMKDQQDHHEVIVAKQRNGPTGDVPVAFVKEYASFEVLA